MLVNIGLVSLITITAVGIFVWKRRKNQLARKINKCDGCGYNLAHNCSGRCPECGKSIEENYLEGIRD